MRIGTPLSDTAVRVMLLGAGELGKEVAIELQRLGAEVVAVDRYPNAPAMQVAHRSHVIPMTDAQVLNVDAGSFLHEYGFAGELLRLDGFSAARRRP